MWDLISLTRDSTQVQGVKVPSPNHWTGRETPWDWLPLISMLFEIAVVVQSLSHVLLFVIPWTAAQQASLSFTMSWSFLRLMSFELVMLSNHLIFCCSLLLLPSTFLSIRVFSNESVFHIRKPSIGALALASVLPVSIQGWFPLGPTGLISLLSKEFSRVFSNTTVQKHPFFFWHLAFFMVQLAYLYSTAGKTIVLTTGTFVSKARSRLVIAFLPRSKHLLILWLQSSSTVILEPKKIKSATVSTSPPVLRLIHVIVAIKSVGGYLPGSSVKTLGFHCRGRRT